MNDLKEILSKYVKSTNEISKEFMEELKKDCKSYKEVKEKLSRLQKEIIWSCGDEKSLNIALSSYAESLLDKEMKDLLPKKVTVPEGLVQEQSLETNTINQLRIKNGLKAIPKGNVHFIPIK